MIDRPRAVLYDLPIGIREMVCEAADGSVVVLLNARFSRETNRQSYIHALSHVKDGDLDRFLDVGEAEKEKHHK